MGRTKMEVDALTSKIYQLIDKKVEQKRRTVKAEAQKIYDEQIAPLVKERQALLKKINAKIKKLGIEHYTEDFAVEDLCDKLAGIEPVHYDLVEREVILASDQGADVLIKKITEMFV